MKKSLFLIFILGFVLNSNFFANDTYFFTSGGNLQPTTEKNISIRMKEEVINIVCEKNYYKVTVDFDFENTGNGTTLSVGFPFFEVGVGGHGKIFDFECWTNGIKTEYKDMLIDREFSNTNYGGNFDEPELINAYVREITFPKNSITKTRITYKSEYGRDTGGYIIKYLYGTGSSWKDTIGKITVIVENNLPYDYIFGKSETWKRIADNKWQAIFYNVEPEYKECFTFHTDNILHDTGPKCFPAYFPYIKQKAQSSWFEGYTSAQLRILRNTIYALHGYNFKSEDLKKFFTEWGQYWNPEYKVNPNFSEDDLSEIEKYNINLILAEEKRRQKE